MQRMKARWQLVMIFTCLNIIFCIVDESGFSTSPGSESKRTFNGIKDSIMPSERNALSNSSGRNCLKCLLKSSCNSNPVNYWHPDKCPTIIKFDQRTVHERCPNFSLLFVGDSRTKILFDAVVQKIHGENATIIKSKVSIKQLQEQDKSRAPLDFWTDPVKHKQRQLKFRWDTTLKISKSTLEEDINAMKPEAVIIGGGLWFLRDHLRDFEGYRTALQELLHRSMGIFIKHNTPLVVLKHYPIVTPRDGIRQYDIDELNAILRQETAKYEKDERLIVWDSYEHLLQSWKAVCYHPGRVLSPREAAEWACEDPLHPGPIVVQHMADVLLSFVCGRGGAAEADCERRAAAWRRLSLEEQMTIQAGMRRRPIIRQHIERCLGWRNG